MKKVYVDNSATSFPKAPGVSDAMKDFLDNVGCNVNRGGYESSYHAAMEVLHVRKLLCELFHFNEPRNIIFTSGITCSLNMILKGFLRAGDHVITTSMEHNGVMRTLHQLSENGVIYDIAMCDEEGCLNPDDIESRINAKTKAVVMTHASNVCGTILPIEAVSKICGARGVRLIVDSAQTAGILDIDMSHIDALAFACHKGLLASQGLGGFAVRSDMAEEMSALITGGTGSLSHEITQPCFLPDKFEAGTMNIPAVMGLKKALEYIKTVGIQSIFGKEMRLAEKFISEMEATDGVKIIGRRGMAGRTAVVSLDFQKADNARIATMLDTDCGIMTRCGLHCAPNAHKTLSTYPQGTVRFSFGHFNTPEDVEYIVQSIREIRKRSA